MSPSSRVLCGGSNAGGGGRGGSDGKITVLLFYRGMTKRLNIFQKSVPAVIFFPTYSARALRRERPSPSNLLSFPSLSFREERMCAGPEQRILRAPRRARGHLPLCSAACARVCPPAGLCVCVRVSPLPPAARGRAASAAAAAL